MSKPPAAEIVAAPYPPEGSGVSGAVNIPAPSFTQSARHEQRAAESLLVVGERWQSTGKADAGLDRRGAVPDAAKPTPFTTYGRKSPFWKWT